MMLTSQFLTPFTQCLLQRDELGYSALHHAAIAGLRDMAELLIEVGEDVDAKGQDGARGGPGGGGSPSKD